MKIFQPILGALLLVSSWSMAGSLTTTGQGQVSLVPDMARVQVSISAEHANASSALEAADASAGQLIDALLALGIEPADIATVGLQLYPSQEWRNGEVVREFFIASHRLSVGVRDLTKIGMVLDDVTSLRADVSFSLNLDVSDRESALQLALANAMADARTKAEILAGAERMVIQTISDIQSQLFSPVTSADDTRESDLTSVNIAPGEFTVSAFVRVTYEIAE